MILCVVMKCNICCGRLRTLLDKGFLICVAMIYNYYRNKKLGVDLNIGLEDRVLSFMIID